MFAGIYLNYNQFLGAPVHLDIVLACILISIGAMVAYLADESLQFTPRLAEWLVRVLGD